MAAGNEVASRLSVGAQGVVPVILADPAVPGTDAAAGAGAAWRRRPIVWRSAQAFGVAEVSAYQRHGCMPSPGLAGRAPWCCAPHLARSIPLHRTACFTACCARDRA